MARTFAHRFAPGVVAVAIVFAGYGLVQAKAPGKAGVQGSDAGIRFKLQASEKEIGLPIYPGAVPHHDDKGDTPAANLGFWGSSFGFKLVVLKMESKDAPAKVAAFYQKALAKYGKVLDCAQGEPKQEAKGGGKGANVLTCEDDRPEAGGMLYKAGSKNKQHIVHVKPNGPGSVFEMIFIDARGMDDEKPL